MRIMRRGKLDKETYLDRKQEIAALDKKFASQELTKEILQSLVSRIVVNPGGEAEIYWK